MFSSNELISRSRVEAAPVSGLMLRLSLAGECRRRIKFGSDRRVDPFDFDGFHVCGFALRLRTRNFFNLTIESFIGDHFEIGHLCVEPNAVLTATFNIDHERFRARPGRVPGDSEGVRSRIEMERHETTEAHMGDTLWAVEEPPGERLLTFWKETCGHALCRIALCIEGNGARLSIAACGRKACNQSNTEEFRHGFN